MENDISCLKDNLNNSETSLHITKKKQEMHKIMNCNIFSSLAWTDIKNKQKFCQVYCLDH